MQKLSKQTRVSFRRVLFVSILIFGISMFSRMSVNATTVSDDSLSYSSLTPHDPIEITGDGHFKVFLGSGTAEDPYIIEGYNITTTNDFGIHISWTTRYFIVRNCYIDTSGFGINIYQAAYGTATFINNTFINNNYYGISLSSSGGATVVNNTFTNCGLNIQEYSIYSYLSYTVENNWVNGKKLGFHTNLDSTTITEPVYGQLILINCINVTVRDQILNNAGTGLFLYSCASSVIINNTCNKNYRIGIFLHSSSSSTVANNTCNNKNYGIKLWDSGSSTVANNTCINNNWYGIFLHSSSSSTVANNTCSNNKYGISLVYSSWSTVANNTCSNNNWGIYIQYSYRSTVINNTFTNCGLNIHESAVATYLGYTVENNRVNNRKLGFYSNLDSTTIAEPVYGQLILVNCTNVTVRDQILNNSTTALFLYSCPSSAIINNTCSNNNYIGISLSYSSSSTITKNMCENNKRYGIDLWFSGSSSVTNNACSNNDLDGIYLKNSGSSTIIDNICENNNRNGISLMFSSSSTVANTIINNNNFYGIFLGYSISSTVINNTCNNNNWNGIYLYYSDFCVITYNLLQENREHGVYLVSDCNNNTIHHNTFVDNNLGGTSQAYDGGKNNIWYDSETLEGNYWSDCSGTGNYSIAGSASSIDLYTLDEPAEYTVETQVFFTFILLSVLVPLILIKLFSRKNNKKIK